MKALLALHPQKYKSSGSKRVFWSERGRVKVKVFSPVIFVLVETDSSRKGI